ncbi:MAG: hypothetical protein B6241_09305 [Spirochaetaceae bacterium 4572_59]|nr:MAG: hypothetical protein B6241_09305 [Spirochaetaceae bacterium 4572_59]
MLSAILTTMKKNLFLFTFLLLPLFSVSSENLVVANIIREPSFSTRDDRIPGKIPADWIESVLEESEEEKEEEENLEENLQQPSCISRIYSRICSDFFFCNLCDSSLPSYISLTLPLLRAPPCYS